MIAEDFSKIDWKPGTNYLVEKSIGQWLSYCIKMHDAGQEDQIPVNPFYKSKKGILTDDYVDRVIKAIDDEFARELRNNGSWHMNPERSGSKIPPEFHRLGRSARRALVEGLDKLLGHEIVS